MSSKRTYRASSLANTTTKPPRKRPRRFVEYVPELSPKLDNLVHLAVVGSKSSKGQFSIRNTTHNIESPLEALLAPPEVVDIPPEDPDAVDAHEWHDMLDDNVVQVVKTKRKQRNDSVSPTCLLHVMSHS